MHPSQIIVLATPVFFALIALEYWVSVRRGLRVYRMHDMVASLSCGILSQVTALFTKAFMVGIYAFCFEHLALTRLPMDNLAVWAAGLFLYDFFYYWNHRFGHDKALFWAAHAVHHQSEDYNLSTALRQTSTGWIGSWVFYLPMAVMGFPPEMYAALALIDLLYQYWVHTQLVGRLGWFDRVFCSPSNHRAHHAVNDRYLDKNYGGILILFDRWFGTFVEEDPSDPPVFGTRSPLRNWNPLWANFQVYVAIWRDAAKARSWWDKLRIWWMPPGWRPQDVAEGEPKDGFDIEVQRYYDPQLTRSSQWLLAMLLAASLGATSLLLWHAHELALSVQLLWALGLTVLLHAAAALGGQRGLGDWWRAAPMQAHEVHPRQTVVPQR